MTFLESLEEEKKKRLAKVEALKASLKDEQKKLKVLSVFMAELNTTAVTLTVEGEENNG